MVAKNVASCNTSAQRDRFGGLSAHATSDDVRNFNSFDLSALFTQIYQTI